MRLFNANQRTQVHYVQNRKATDQQKYSSSTYGAICLFVYVFVLFFILLLLRIDVIIWRDQLDFCTGGRSVDLEQEFHKADKVFNCERCRTILFFWTMTAGNSRECFLDKGAVRAAGPKTPLTYN